MSPRHRPEELGIAWRLTFAVLGVVLLVVGLAGLALPGIQGVLTLILALVCLSLASETVHRGIRWSFQRWPRGWRRFLRGRRWVERKVLRSPRRSGSGSRNEDSPSRSQSGD